MVEAKRLRPPRRYRDLELVVESHEVSDLRSDLGDLLLAVDAFANQRLETPAQEALRVHERSVVRLGDRCESSGETVRLGGLTTDDALQQLIQGRAVFGSFLLLALLDLDLFQRLHC